MEDHSGHLYDLTKIILPYLLIFGSFILSIIIVTKYKIPKIEKDLVEIEKLIVELRKEQEDMATNGILTSSLLDPSGNPRYQPVSRCNDLRDFCGRQNDLLLKNVGEKIEGVGDRMVEVLTSLDQKRMCQQQENNKKFEDLTSALKRTNERLGNASDKLNGIAHKVENITSNGTVSKLDVENLFDRFTEKITKGLKS